jgi:PAS domain S-box-containing protein
MVNILMKKIIKFSESMLLMREFMELLENCNFTDNFSESDQNNKNIIRKNNEQFLEELDLDNKAIWVINNEGRNIFVNNKSAQLFGYDEKEIIGQYLFNFMDETKQIEALNNFVNKRVDAVEQLKFIRKNGDDLFVEIVNKTLYDTSKKKWGRFAIMTEIT